MNLVIETGVVRKDKEGRYSLNDLHKAALAAGHDVERKNPANFLRNDFAKDFIKVVEKKEVSQNEHFSSAVSVVNGGRKPGTYAVKSLAIRYAMWISPSILDLFIKQIEDMDSVTKALNDFEIPDDLPDMFVYAIRNKDTGNVKIGISKHPEERLKQLQTGCDGLLELIAVRPAENRYADEKRLHNDNSKHHIHGEWFTEEAVV